MSDVKPVACGKDFFARLNEKLKHIRNQAVRLPRSADGTIGSTMQFVRKEHAALQAEIEELRVRLNWVLPMLTGSSEPEADKRTIILAQELMRGKDGIEALDAAIAKEKQQESLK